jgi:hypothetical protein
VLVPSLGGLLLGVALLLVLRWRPAREIDPIEANALHGGRMSFRGSTIVALQTTWSSGVGASVGLEADAGERRSARFEPSRLRFCRARHELQAQTEHDGAGRPINPGLVRQISALRA